MSRKLQARIDLAALKHNLQKVREIAPGRSIIAMVKANAYGHGLVPIAQALAEANADAFGVARIEEALQLRQAGIQQKIVLCEGVIDSEELSIAIAEAMDVVIHSEFQLELLEGITAENPVKIWLKIDTGMNRLGFDPQDATAVIARLAKINCVQVVGIMTHFSDASDIDNQKTILQLEKFKSIVASLNQNHKYPLSLANSAAILAWPESHADWVRPGIMLYGVSPFKDRNGEELGLQQVMSLETSIISIKQAKQGSSIGYNSRFVCKEDMKLGVIAIGYGDGYTAKIPDGTPVLVNGQKAKIVGQVSMDMSVVDLSQIPKVKIGDKVVIWGKGLPVEEIAEWVDVLPYELLVAVAGRVGRCYC